MHSNLAFFCENSYSGEGFRRAAPSDVLARSTRAVLRPEGPKRHQARVGREERCDDRETPDEAKRNRHAPGGSRRAAGVKRMESRTRREKPAFAGFEAVREGFEPPVRCRTPVFEAGSFNHSDISPWVLGLQIYKNYSKSNLFFSGEITHQGYLVVAQSFGALCGDTADGV